MTAGNRIYLRRPNDAKPLLEAFRGLAVTVWKALCWMVRYDIEGFERAKNGSRERGWLDETLHNKQIEIIDDIYR